MAGKHPISSSAASRIQSTQAKAGKATDKNSFPARVQSAAATNANKSAGGAAKAPNTGAGAGAKPASGGKPSKK
ncbi:hypothetical protein Hypma_001686 [Hypsizygus marmoreus]|uniref:SMP domain-containing protein n=1 Tax=Hypsizygus marmoreus TaxID=39966 RepID=A0A369JAC3_HYPMA|nr:hypothetical protein Hypma_001686 [Hypsizygus marmoreus]